MPITRTVMVDDDGTGTTGTVLNNAWLQTIYNQIDGVSTVEYGTFTPHDASAAGLTFSTAQGTYAKWGRIVFIWGQVIYPGNSNGSAAKIGTLPFIIRVPVGAAQGYGVSRVWWMPVNSVELNPLNASTSVALTNADMSGGNYIFSATYLTD